jgi:hypothetical protein
MFHAGLTYFSCLKMEAIRTSETSVVLTFRSLSRVTVELRKQRFVDFSVSIIRVDAGRANLRQASS